MVNQWLKGTVKAVPSGDSLLIMGNVASGPPPEKTITLSSLIAPRLARRGGQDEPFAWESREFLRKRCVGKDVIFRVDYVVPSINREFGSVFIGEANLALEVVGAGWAKVRPPMGQNSGEVSVYLEELEQLEQQAKQKGIGMWNRAPGAVEKSVRDLPPSAVGDSTNFDATSFANANRLKVLPAIVEQVRDGGTVRVYLLPEFQYVQVFITGIQSPSMGRRAMVAESQASTVNGEQESVDASNASGSSGGVLTTAQRLAASTASVEVPPEPYAREAKHFTEVRVLNRDVRVIVEGADKFGNLIGSVHYPQGDVAVDLALELLKHGLAKVVEWSARLLDEDAKRTLKNAELTAKKERLRLWTNFVPPASNSTAIRDGNFKGRVVEVVSGDCIIVADDAAPYGSLSAERRVNLSSIRAPKMGNAKRQEKPANYAREAKEFIRSRLIGQEVNVVMEYSRKVTASDGPVPDVASGDVRNMDFGSVFLPSTSKVDTSDVAPALPVPGQPEGINVAEVVLARGFATVVRHRDFEDRSNYYDALLAAEARAKKGKKGLHSEKEPAPDRINDLSLPDSSGPRTQSTAQKAKQFLPFLQRAKRLPALVDYVLSGHRYKILIPRETCAIAFSLSGVRCPGRGEPFAEEAIGFMRRKILQRDVEIEVEAVDRTGTFLGSLWESKTNVAVLLLEAGLAKLHPFFSTDRTTEGHLLVQAEERAKKEKRKVWENYIEGKEEENAASLDGTKQNQEVLKVKVTEVLGGGKFYAQVTNDARVSSLQMQLEGLRVKEKALPPVNFEPKKGEIVMAEFSADGSWNRAMVVNAPWQSASKDGYEVFYIDYGNQEKVPLSKLRPLDSSISFGTPGLALLLNLAYVRIPELEEDYGQEGAEYLSSMIGDKVFMAKVMEKDTSGGKVKGQGTGTKLSVFLYDVEPGKSINSLMLQAGYARVVKKNRWDPKEKQEELEKLAEFQETARKQRLNIWQYGDIESDEEDTAPARPARR
ncbi:hypothetical protein GOP47_0000542 [Adiantum capillus-veneris]|uniref:Ribonuclease n=1 Tax=Adiantum capillus-veneris TaxID=13818 RepID=A0A9D4VDQ4_ADICA|nr:hypothetical protein GOP47_0000542 [Adiantum capillus-veneris]